MSIEIQALRDTAKGAVCQVRIPGCKNERSTTVWAHSDAGAHGKGMSLKADDIMGMHSCGFCHEQLPKLKRAAREMVEAVAILRTWAVLWRAGVIGMLKGKQREPLPARMQQRQKFSESTATPSKCVPRPIR